MPRCAWCARTSARPSAPVSGSFWHPVWSLSLVSPQQRPLPRHRRKRRRTGAASAFSRHSPEACRATKFSDRISRLRRVQMLRQLLNRRAHWTTAQRCSRPRPRALARRLLRTPRPEMAGRPALAPITRLTLSTRRNATQIPSASVSVCRWLPDVDASATRCRRARLGHGIRGSAALRGPARRRSQRWSPFSRSACWSSRRRPQTSAARPGRRTNGRRRRRRLWLPHAAVRERIAPKRGPRRPDSAAARCSPDRHCMKAVREGVGAGRERGRFQAAA
jgi:hypothetical protein